MSIFDALFISLQSIAISLGTILLGVIFGKWCFIRGAVLVDFKDLLYRLITGRNQAIAVFHKIKEWAVVATTDGVLGLIGVPESESNRVAGKGLELVLMGKDREEIQAQLDAEVMASLDTVNVTVKRVWLAGAVAIFFALLASGIGLTLCFAFSGIESIRLLGLYTMAMSLCYALFLVTPIWIFLITGLKKLSKQLKLESEIVVMGLSMISEGETVDNVVAKMKEMVTENA